MNPTAREQTEVHGGQRKEKETGFDWFENTKIFNITYIYTVRVQGIAIQ
jgi:hypothetical protein